MTTPRKKRAKALGDDPLAWIKAKDAPADVSKNINNPTAESKHDADLSKHRSADQKAPVITLDPIMTINEVNNILATFKALSQEKDISIDASGVHMLDTAGLQLLLCLSQNLQARDHKIHWLSPSPALIQSAKLIGLSELLELPLR